MTCIVSLEHEGVAYLGCDSFMGHQFTRDQVDRPKFFVKGDRFVIGAAGSFRGAQIMEHSLTFRKRRDDEDEEAYLVKEVSRKLHAAFDKEGMLNKYGAEADSPIPNFLICLNGLTFTLQQDLSVIRSRGGCMSIGAGCDYALGALAAMSGSKMSPKAKVRKALEIATKLSPQVCGPYHIIEV